jgi:hypothetical protein
MLAIVFGVLFVAAGLVVSTRAGIIETRAAGAQRIPLWKTSRGYRRPLASLLLVPAALVLNGIGALLFLTVWGGVAILLISLALLPPVVVIAIHNRSLQST